MAGEVRYELSFISLNSDCSLRASLAVVDLTIALHYVFHAPVDKLLWDVGEQVLLCEKEIIVRFQIYG